MEEEMNCENINNFNNYIIFVVCKKMWWRSHDKYFICGYGIMTPAQVTPKKAIFKLKYTD